MPATLETSGLVKHFGGVRAANEVTLAVERGEIRGLIGPNGAGKTTLVNLVTGVHPPDAGTIRLDGRDITGLAIDRIAKRGLLRSFQVARLFGSLTVRENLMTAWLARAGSGGDGAQATERMLQLTTLAPLAGLPAKKLSGGQRALLQVACGFIVPASCYVLDEPFAGINPVIKDAIIELIFEVNRSHGSTFLVVSHEMTVIRKLCRQVTVMMEGRVVAQGTLDEVARRPDVLAGYLGKALE